MSDCLFCKIVNGELPSKKVYEDEHVLAFHDLYPVAPVHVLFVPKIHVDNVGALTQETLPVVSAIHNAIVEVSKKLGVDHTGFRLITNHGKDAAQTVYHLHYHMLGGKDLGPKIL